MSPLVSYNIDLQSRLTANVSAPLKIDLSNAKQISSLENIPRYMVYNSDSGKVYYAKSVDQKFSPASFTKLLSTQVVLDLVSPEQLITATTESVDKVPTVLGIRPGEQLTISELLRGAIATSANDAAQTLADGTISLYGLDRKSFIDLMNKKATLIGASNSHFENPDGLDDQNQYSTLLDMTRIINNVQHNYPDIIAAGKSDREDIFTTATHGKYYLPNWNGLLGVYPGVNGLKIAYTENAGYSSIVTGNIDGQNLIAIVSGADSIIERDRAASDLLDAALIEEHISPKKISKYQFNLHYKKWGDLARQIRQETEELKSK